MDELKQVCAWIQTFPLWQGAAPAVDTTQSMPGSCGLFPLGMLQTGQRSDVLGNRTVTCQEQFLLRRRAVRGLAAAAWLLEFQHWVRQQSQLGLCPQLGDGVTQFQAEKGRLSAPGQSCTDIYEVRLTATYTKYCEGE